MLLRSAAAVTTAAVLILAGCGSDDTDPKDDPTGDPTDDIVEEGLTESDLEKALLTLRDVSSLADDIEEAEADDSDDLSGDDLISGADACADFIDGEFGPEEEIKVNAEFEALDSEIYVYSTVELYAEGEAEENLEAVRDLFAECTEFTIDFEGTPLDVSVMFIELGELGGYDFGDEGLAVDMEFYLDGTRVLNQGYTLVRIDDVLTISGGATSGTLGDDIMLTITEAAVERLEKVLDEA